MEITSVNTLKSKVKRCTCCGLKNQITYNDIKKAPISGFYGENGGYYYFECKYCNDKNYICEIVAKSLVKNLI